MPESNAAERLVQPPGAAPAAGASRLRSTASLKDRLLLQLVGLKIPMLLFVGPRVVRLDEEGCEVHIPLSWRSRNHLKVMYVGVLCAGADLAAGLNALNAIRSSGRRVDLLFKDLQASFFKRADGDVLFRSSAGLAVNAAVRRTVETGERVTIPVEVAATVPDRHGDEPVARFTMGLTMKAR
jgi:acyl-coenzyme A thioesterase PaaI-like protein